MIQQYQVSLKPRPRGFHLITHEVEAAIQEWPQKGLLNILLQHTSAGLSLNENADYSVRDDFESFMNHLVPENHPLYTHVFEGSDDMPAHLKSSLMGASLTLPITRGRLNLGTWQGIYLGEFRNHGGSRRLVLTIYS